MKKVSTFTLAEMTKWANLMGAHIDEDHVGDQPGYWIVDGETREGIWEDENFCTSLEEVEHKLYKLEDELVAKELEEEDK